VKLPIWLASVGLDIPISTRVVAGGTQQGEFVLRLHEGAPGLAFDGSTGSQSFDPSSPVAKGRRFPSFRLAVDAITRNLSYHGRRCREHGQLSTMADESRSELSTGPMKPLQILIVRSVELSDVNSPKKMRPDGCRKAIQVLNRLELLTYFSWKPRRPVEESQ